MLYLSEDTADICSILFIVFGVLDLVMCSLTSFIIIRFSPNYMIVYKWALVNTVLSGLSSDITAALLSPVLIEPYLGFYSISKLNLSPLLMHLLFCLYFVSILYIIFAISITYYYRIGISLSSAKVAKAASLLRYTKILYPLSYLLGPFGALVLTIDYTNGILDYSTNIISLDDSLWPLRFPNSPVAMIYSLRMTWMRLFILSFLCLFIAGGIFFGYAVRLMIQRWKSGGILISTQTNQVRRQMWQVMILQIVLLFLTAGLPFIFYLSTIFGAPPIMPQEVTCLAPLHSCIHSLLNCPIILLVTKHYRVVVYRFFGIKIKSSPRPNETMHTATQKTLSSNSKVIAWTFHRQQNQFPPSLKK